MRHFTVVVHPKRVQIEEQEKPTRTADFKAVVDGVDVLYEIKKHHNTSPYGTQWRARGSAAIHYHAKNLGTNVSFEHVHHQKRTKSKVRPKQLKLWD